MSYSNQCECCKCSETATYRPATCPYCLADTNHSTLEMNKGKRCPLCGTLYTGERRYREYQVLFEAGLVAEDD